MSAELDRVLTILNELNWPMLYETGGGHEFISDNFYAYTGYYAEEVQHNRDFFPARIHPEDVPELNHSLAEWHKNEEREILKYSFRFKDAFGNYIWMDDFIFEVKNRGKKFMRGVLLISNEDKLEEISLREKRFLLEKSGTLHSDQQLAYEERLRRVEQTRSDRSSLIEELLSRLNEMDVYLEDLYKKHAPQQSIK